jgi:hypothetical protein
MSIGISSVTTAQGGSTTISGTGPPGGGITVTVGTTTHQTTVNSEGIWTITVNVPAGQSVSVSLDGGPPSKTLAVDIAQNQTDSA